MINPLSLLTSAVSWMGSWLPAAVRPASSTSGGIADTQSTMSSVAPSEKPQTFWGWLKSLFCRVGQDRDDNDELKAQITDLSRDETVFAVRTKYETLLRNINTVSLTNDQIREQIASIQKEKAETPDSPDPIILETFFNDSRGTLDLFTKNSRAPGRAFNNPFFQLLQSSAKKDRLIEPVLSIREDHKEMTFTCRDIQPVKTLPKLPKGFQVLQIENGYCFKFVEE